MNSDDGQRVDGGTAVEPLLRVRDCRVTFRTPARDVQALLGVDLDVAAGATVGIVGESGCGKSTLALAVMGLLDARSAQVSGAIRFLGRELCGASLFGAVGFGVTINCSYWLWQ